LQRGVNGPEFATHLFADVIQKQARPAKHHFKMHCKCKDNKPLVAKGVERGSIISPGYS